MGASATAQTCSGPADLEARLRDHADAGAYAALSNWFSTNGQTDCATAVLQSGLKAFPDSDALTAALVSLDVRESHFEEASVLSRTLALAKPRDLEAQRIYLRTLINAGDNDAAAKLGTKLLALAPRDADLLNLNGFLERKAGDYDAARKHLEEAVAIHPNDKNARVNLGLALAQLEDAAGAREQLENAIALGADEPQVHFELAKVLRTLGESKQAQQQLTLYQQKQKQESDHSLAVLKATEAAQAVKAGDNRKAADMYREACAAEPGNAAFAYRLALVLDDLGDLAGERTALEQAINADPTLILAQYRLGYLDFRAGDNAAAEKHFQLTVEAAPDNAQAWVSLAAVLANESRTQEARAAVARALKIEPNNAAALALSSKLAEADKH